MKSDTFVEEKIQQIKDKIKLIDEQVVVVDSIVQYFDMMEKYSEILRNNYERWRSDIDYILFRLNKLHEVVLDGFVNHYNIIIRDLSADFSIIFEEVVSVNTGTNIPKLGK